MPKWKNVSLPCKNCPECWSGSSSCWPWAVFNLRIKDNSSCWCSLPQPRLEDFYYQFYCRKLWILYHMRDCPLLPHYEPFVHQLICRRAACFRQQGNLLEWSERPLEIIVCKVAQIQFKLLFTSLSNNASLKSKDMESRPVCKSLRKEYCPPLRSAVWLTKRMAQSSFDNSNNEWRLKRFFFFFFWRTLDEKVYRDQTEVHYWQLSQVQTIRRALVKYSRTGKKGKIK